MPSTTFLADTNVLSELSKPTPNPGVLGWVEGISEVALSVVTVEEVLYGLSWRPKPRIEEWFVDFLERFCYVLPISIEIARQAGHLRGSLKAKGHTRTQSDMLIAATAQVHGLTVVTRNTGDFEDCGVSILDPFTRSH